MTPSTSDLLDGLAERVEAARGPDRKLDLEVSVAVNFRGVFAGDLLDRWGGGWRWGAGGDHIERQLPDGKTRGLLDPAQFVPGWTSSLDAAMTLASGTDGYHTPDELLREAMERMWKASIRLAINYLDTQAYREALARFFTAACLRAAASKAREGVS